MTTPDCLTPGCPNPNDGHGRCRPCRNRMRRERNVILDLLAIETAVRNHRAPRGMKPRERQAAGLQLSQLGLSASEIARIFGVTARTVHRWRARSRLTRPPS